MSEDEFTKLFKYISKRFDLVEKRLERAATKDDFNYLANAVDAFAKQSETYMREMLALGHKVDRSEQWILKVAKATSVKLAA